MKTELANLNAEKERLLAEYKAARAEAQEYETVKQNVDALLTVAKEQEQQRRDPGAGGARLRSAAMPE